MHFIVLKPILSLKITSIDTFNPQAKVQEDMYDCLEILEPGAVLCGHGAVDHAVQEGHGQVFAGYPLFVKGHHFLAARKTPTSYAPDIRINHAADFVVRIYKWYLDSSDNVY